MAPTGRIAAGEPAGGGSAPAIGLSECRVLPWTEEPKKELRSAVALSAMRSRRQGNGQQVRKRRHASRGRSGPWRREVPSSWPGDPRAALNGVTNEEEPIMSEANIPTPTTLAELQALLVTLPPAWPWDPGYATVRIRLTRVLAQQLVDLEPARPMEPGAVRKVADMILSGQFPADSIEEMRFAIPLQHRRNVSSMATGGTRIRAAILADVDIDTRIAHIPRRPGTAGGPFIEYPGEGRVLVRLGCVPPRQRRPTAEGQSPDHEGSERRGAGDGPHGLPCQRRQGGPMATPTLGTAPELIRAGSTAFLEVQCFDLTQETEPLLDPSGRVTVTIKRPDGTVYTGPSFLTRLSQGVYGLNQQTQVTDPLGTYTGEIIAVSGNVTSSRTSRLHGVQLFTLVSG